MTALCPQVGVDLGCRLRVAGGTDTTDPDYTSACVVAYPSLRIPEETARSLLSAEAKHQPTVRPANHPTVHPGSC